MAKYEVLVEKSNGTQELFGICDSALEALVEGQTLRNSKAITNRVWPGGVTFVAVIARKVEESE